MAENLELSGVYSSDEIYQAGDGTQGLLLFDRVQPEIVVSDLRMPVMDGASLIREIRALHANPEIIVVSGETDLDSALELFELRVHEFLRKPFRADEWVILIRKVKENLRVRRENEKIKQQLMRSEKLATMGLLAAGVAHEINNPNTFVKGNLEILMRLASLLESHWKAITHLETDAVKRSQLEKLGQEMKPLISAAVDGSARIKTIISSLLVMARSSHSEKSAVSLEILIQRSLQLCRHRVEQIQVETQFDIKKDATVWVNEQEILQVLMNLISNAADAVQETTTLRGVPGRIRLTVFEPLGHPRSWGIRILDNGPGIPPEVREKIFEPFFTTKSLEKGTGLGLSISLGYVENNQGTLEIESPPEFPVEFHKDSDDASFRTGSAFTIYLPRAERS